MINCHEYMLVLQKTLRDWIGGIPMRIVRINLGYCKVHAWSLEQYVQYSSPNEILNELMFLRERLMS